MKTSLSEMNAEQWFEFALEAEQTMKDIGIYDPAYPFFFKEREGAFKKALELEQKEHPDENP